MELTFLQQSTAFFMSAVLGMCLAVLYGLLKFLRYTFSPGKAAVITLDILFMLAWALSVFFFSLGYLLGYIRLYVLFGSFLGFALYRLTLGRLFFLLYRPVIRFIKTAFNKICIKLKIFAKYLLKIAGKVLYNIVSKKEDLRNKRSGKKTSYPRRKSNETKKTKNKKSKGRPGRDRGSDRRSEGAGKA